MSKILIIKGCLNCPYNRNVAGHSYCGGDGKNNFEKIK